MKQTLNFKPFLAATMALPILAIMFSDASQIFPCFALGLIASALCFWRLICLLIKGKPGNPNLIRLASALAVFFSRRLVVCFLSAPLFLSWRWSSRWERF